ncbi:MAG TPA: tetratricopeptide repeat protein, partial [Gemmataceae bacterium]
MNVLRSALFGCLIIGLVLNSSATVRTESPKPSPTREQQEKLKERDLYLAEANRLQREGKLVEAIAAAGKKLAIERQVFGDVHEDVAGSLESLAEMHHQRENFAAARKARQEVLTIRVKLHGEEHWKVTDARLALADVERLGRMTPRQRQRLAEANRLNGEVVALYQQGRFREAVDQARQVLEIRKQALGEQHPDYATSLNNLALLYLARNDGMQSLKLAHQAWQIIHAHLDLTANIQSERQQLRMNENLRFYLDSFLSAATAAKMSGDDVYAEVLAWKGSVSLRQQQMRLLRRELIAGDPKTAKLFTTLEAATRRLAALVNTTPAPKQLDDYRRRLDEANTEVERRQQELAAVSAPFRKSLEQRRCTPAELCRALPAGVALVDLVEYRAYTPQAKGHGTWQPRLAAFVVR